MKYRYATWCRFCAGADNPICDDIETSDETFDTPEDARQAAEKYCDGYVHMDYKVIDESSKEVEANQ
jgi:hypothetical protein